MKVLFKSVVDGLFISCHLLYNNNNKKNDLGFGEHKKNEEINFARQNKCYTCIIFTTSCWVSQPPFKLLLVVQ